MPVERPPAVTAARVASLPPVGAAATSIECAGPAVIAALSVESACLLRRIRRLPALESRISVHRSGPGAARAAQFAAEAVERGASGLVSWGLAGGLVPAAEPGVVVLPKCIVGSSGGPPLPADAAWHTRLAETLRPRFPLLEGELLATPAVLGRPEEKARAAAESGAVAVDMESEAIAEAAAAAGLPFVAVRVVADGAADLLPPGIEQWIDARGNRRPAAVARAALMPAEWPALFVLAARYAAARRTLEALAESLVPAGFLLQLGRP